MSAQYHLKFYADCPAGGDRNKLFCYPVQDGKHACDLLARFVAKDFKLRAAFLGAPGALGAALPASAINFPSSIASASSLLIKYPPLTDVAPPTSAELDALMLLSPVVRAAILQLRGAA
ncbi:MAG: hypothetical protein EOO60_03635 [Hymenobacter sp.]|nr:MAG: hypothetical protein EOO60_03635 [Hymenobacter sp.]